MKLILVEESSVLNPNIYNKNVFFHLLSLERSAKMIQRL